MSQMHPAREENAGFREARPLAMAFKKESPAISSERTWRR